MAEPRKELKVKTAGLVPAEVKLAAKKEKKAPLVGEIPPSMYERMKGEAPVLVVEGEKGHPLDEFGPAYWTKGTPWALRGDDAAQTPKEPFIYSQGPKRRLKIKGGLMIGPTVHASPEATMAHEVGHATDRTEGGLSGRILQSGLARGGGQALGTGLGTLGGVMAGHALWKKPHLAIPASMVIGAAGAGLGSVPTLLSESRATKRGKERLRAAGATDKQMERYNAQLAGAYGTYKRQALINAVGGGLLAPAMLLRTKYAASEEQGAYKGVPMSPHTVKFKTEFQGVPINVDRPKGFIMKGTDAKGNDWARRYKYDYGFIPKTLGGDGDGLDVFIGPDKKADYAFWAMQRDDDGNFDEYKVFLGFPDRDAAVAAYRQHIPKKYFKGIVTMKVEMMKAMLGKVNPDEKIKRASITSFLDEFGWMMSTSEESPMPKEAGSKIRSMLYLKEKPGRYGGKKFSLNLKREGGKDIGIGWVGVDEAGRIGESQIDPKFQGMGLGKKMYGEIMRRMPEQTLKSDYRTVSGRAAKIWEGMEKRPGYNLKKGPQQPSVTKDHLGLYAVGNPKPGSRESMFSASLPPEAAL